MTSKSSYSITSFFKSNCYQVIFKSSHSHVLPPFFLDTYNPVYLHTPAFLEKYGSASLHAPVSLGLFHAEGAQRTLAVLEPALPLGSVAQVLVTAEAPGGRVVSLQERLVLASLR